MRIAFDIGGVISKYPEEFRAVMAAFEAMGHTNILITDMPNKSEILEILRLNDVLVPEDLVFCADHAIYGEMCKAVLLKELQVDLFIDDFLGYLAWDSRFGSAPIRLMVMPDASKPYWHDSWRVPTDCNFGRRKYIDGSTLSPQSGSD